MAVRLPLAVFRSETPHSFHFAQGQALYTSTGQPVQIVMSAQQPLQGASPGGGAGPGMVAGHLSHPMMVQSQPVTVQYRQDQPSQGMAAMTGVAGAGGAAEAPRRPPAKRKSQQLAAGGQCRLALANSLYCLGAGCCAWNSPIAAALRTADLLLLCWYCPATWPLPRGATGFCWRLVDHLEPLP
jgi:hypothetical protein